MNNSKLSRKEREKLRHREEILDSAGDLFSEKGYVSVSMSEIAERAEFATGTLYNFFENKKELYRALVTRYIDRAHSILFNALEHGENEYEKIVNFARAKIEIFKEHSSFLRIYLSEIRGLGFTLEKDLFKEKLDEIISELVTVFEKGIEKGIFRDINPEYLAVALNGLTSIFLVHILEGGGREEVDMSELVSTSLELFFKNVLVT